MKFRPDKSLNDNSIKDVKTVVETNIDAGFTKPAGGGRMIRNKSSVRNRVTRKRNKQNKQRRKTKRRITRRTTRKRRNQCKRRRTKKRN